MKRSIKELLQVMLEDQNGFSDGLCRWCMSLCFNKKINCYEYFYLIEYIRTNRPSKYSSIAAFKCSKTPYYWPKNKISYRIKWIKKHIKKLS